LQKIRDAGIHFEYLPIAEDTMFNRFFWSVTEKAGIIGSKHGCYFLPPKRKDSLSATSDKSNLPAQIIHTVLKAAIEFEKKNVTTDKKLIRIVNIFINSYIYDKMEILTDEWCKQFAKTEYIDFLERLLVPNPQWVKENTLTFIDRVVECFDR
ncbi:MAG: hypothetical protein LBM93_12070, partial [Oscillospiraceae bacterium]|jgi:hypothetical protein|nr:hypothetical protein [Oscillospiraceae bacterium]